MLEYLRNASEKLVAKILISVLAFSFVGWGVAEWIFGASSNDNTLMTVGNADVTAQMYNAVRSRELSQMDRDAQRKVYADKASQDAFAQQVLKNITAQQMMENRAKDLGFVITDKRIASEIRNSQDFQDNGQFSADKFDAALYNAGYSEAEFANVLRTQLARDIINDTISVPVPVPEFAANAAYNARYSQRDIEYTTVKYSDFDVKKPSDADLKKFYEQNPQIVPETRTVSYVFIPAEMAKPDAYDAGYAIAVKVEDDIIAGESMKDTAAKHKVKYVELKPFGRDNRPNDKNLTDSMIANIFDMDAGLESEMLETKNGFMFIVVNNINPAHTAEFDSVKKSLAADWIKEQQKKQAYVAANEILVDLNQQGVMKNKKSATVSRTSGAPDEILVAAFNNEIGQNSIVPGNNAFYVLSVKKSIAPKADKKKMNNLKQELAKMSQTEIKDDYNSFLMREYPININEKVYNRVFVK
ncbi:MAG: peptidylprolyl isomerase [Alphaproteobacteria bacterium]|nr:peptidylprolyl isomerase [Alphaproteobacteria bacterium]